MARVELRGVTRAARGGRILDDVSFTVDQGEFVTLIGASGAGKTSVLRAVAGLDPLTSGTVRFDDRDMTAVPTAERNVGMISQQNTLFPNHRVRANLMLPLLYRIIPRAEARKRVEAESRAHNIDHILERWPSTLSGGEQQLAQIARALVRVPDVFLMDEPLAKLDLPVRNRLRLEIVELQRGYGVTTIYTSNRPEEILAMPDRVVALERGRVVQIGAPLEVRARPCRLAIAELTGAISRLEVSVDADDEGFWLSGDGIHIRAWAPHLARHVGTSVTLAVRPEDVRPASTGHVSAEVWADTFVDSHPGTELRTGAGSLHCFETGMGRGDRVDVMLDRWLLFDGRGHLILSTP